MSSFYLILSSDSSLNEYPNNTLVKFRNVLAQPLTLDLEQWHVSLQSIFISKQLKRSSTSHTIWKSYVHVDCITKLRDTSDTHSLLKIIVSDDSNEKYLNYEVTTREYFPLSASVIQSIGVSILDQNNRVLQLQSAQPTYIKLKFKKMSRNGSFVLTCSSKLSTDFFNNNTPSSFTNRMNHPIALNGEWKVAVTSITLPSEVKSIFNVSNFKIEILNGNNDIMHTIRFEKSDFRASYHLRDVIIHKLINAVKVRDENNEEKNLLFASHIQNRLRVACAQDHLSITIRMSKYLAYILGDNGNSGSTKDNSMTDISLEGTTAAEVHVVFEDEIDVRRMKQSLALVYSDIIDPIHVADDFVRMIKLLPLSTATSSSEKAQFHQSYESQHLDFIAIANNNFSTLTFKIHRSDGELVQFEDETGETSITLLFKHYEKN